MIGITALQPVSGWAVVIGYITREAGEQTDRADRVAIDVVPMVGWATVYDSEFTEDRPSFEPAWWDLQDDEVVCRSVRRGPRYVVPAPIDRADLIDEACSQVRSALDGDLTSASPSDVPDGAR